ncbi:MAG: hydroxyacylglutathione hydrolase [Formivibrio sp.]|nr:hydroxyacylglutathione hydrolase [Formivibrio sp.]
MFSISAVPCFNDNYIWVLQQSREAIAVDPGDAAPLLAHLERKGLTLTAILITHRHSDHIGGLPALAEHFAIPVYGPGSIPGVTHPVHAGNSLALLDSTIQVLASPGHTHEHVSYLACDTLFCGDTLFGAGCGRVFDGNMADMYASLMRLATLPAETLVCCAHEYTQSNLQFAAAVEPQNDAIASRISDTLTKRAVGQPTVPSTMGLERATNPFLRCNQPDVIAAARQLTPEASTPVEIFTTLRNWKNHFK